MKAAPDGTTKTRGRSRTRQLAASFPQEGSLGRLNGIRNLRVFVDDLRSSASVVLQSRSTLARCISSPETSLIPGERTVSLDDESEDEPTCSIVQYETLVEGESRVEVLKYISSLSDELYSKVGGRVCVLYEEEVSEIPNEPEGSTGCIELRVKWAVPLDYFINAGDDTGDDVAMWLIEHIPPAHPEKMEASKGVFDSISLKQMKKDMRSALRAAEILAL